MVEKAKTAPAATTEEAKTEVAMVLTVAQEQLVKGLSKEDRKLFDDASTNEKKGMLVALSLKGVKPVSTLVSVEQEEEANDPMIGVGNIGFRAGDSIQGIFLGTVPMFSKKPKENWDVITHNDKKYYMSMYFRFKRIDSDETFGVYSYSNLYLLKKIETAATTPGRKNPVVGIKYIGLIEGREILEQKYGIKLTQGNSAHVFETTLEKDAVYNRYGKGICNYLKAPYPTFDDNTGSQDENIIAMNNWDKQQAAFKAAASLQVGHDGARQLN